MVRRLFALLSCLAIGFAFTASAQVAGDASGNGVLGLEDAIAVIGMIVDGTQPASPDNADPNATGSVELGDVTWIIDSLINGTPTPKPTATPAPTLDPEEALDREAAALVKYISGGSVDKTGTTLTLTFELKDADSRRVRSPAYVDIRIVNDGGVEVYNNLHYITRYDYTSGDEARVYIEESDIQPGSLNDGTNVDDGTLYFTVYYPEYFAFAERKDWFYGKLPYVHLSESCSLQLPELPVELLNLNYKNEVIEKLNITGLTFKFEDTLGKDKVHLYLYFSGEKIYDVNGPTQGSSFGVGWRLYEDGYVVDNGTYYTPSLFEGDKFRDGEETLLYLVPGNYELRLYNVN